MTKYEWAPAPRAAPVVTFTTENLEQPETQDLLIETMETFLREFEARPKTKFPLKESRRSGRNGPCNEKRWVCKFLGVSQFLTKKPMAVEILKAVCKLRGVQSEYLNESAAASA